MGFLTAQQQDQKPQHHDLNTNDKQYLNHIIQDFDNYKKAPRPNKIIWVSTTVNEELNIWNQKCLTYFGYETYAIEDENMYNNFL